MMRCMGVGSRCVCLCVKKRETAKSRKALGEFEKRLAVLDRCALAAG